MSDPVEMLDGVMARAATLLEPGRWAAEVADRREAVVTRRGVIGDHDDLTAVLAEISFGRHSAPRALGERG